MKWSEEQKERDTLELIALIETAVRENKTMEEIGQIRIPLLWHERPALQPTKYHTVEELEKYGVPPENHHWMKYEGRILIGQDNKPIATRNEDLFGCINECIDELEQWLYRMNELTAEQQKTIRKNIAEMFTKLN